MNTELVKVTVPYEGHLYDLWKRGDGVPRALDLDAGRWLEFDQPHSIRKLIKRHAPALGEVFSTVEKTSRKGGRPGVAHYLTQEQVLYLAAKSETPRAQQVLKTMIAVFAAAMGWRPGAPGPDSLLQAALAQLLAGQRQADERLGRIEVDVAELRRAPQQMPLFVHPGPLRLSSVQLAERLKMTRPQLIALADRHADLRAMAYPNPAPPGVALSWDVAAVERWMDQHRPAWRSAGPAVRTGLRSLDDALDPPGPAPAPDAVLALLARYPAGLQLAQAAELLDTEPAALRPVLSALVREGRAEARPQPAGGVLYAPPRPPRDPGGPALIRAEILAAVQAHGPLTYEGLTAHVHRRNSDLRREVGALVAEGLLVSTKAETHKGRPAAVYSLAGRKEDPTVH